MPESRKQPHLGRLALVLGLTVLWIVLLCARLVQLQILKHQEFVQLANQRQQVTREVIAPRGIIYDSQMDELATNMTVKTVVAEPRKIIRRKEAASAIQSVASTLEIDPVELEAKMVNPARQAFLIVKRRIDPRLESRIEALGIDGIYLIEESMRVYPNRNLASQALGFVNVDGDGCAGLEHRYDKDLKGTPGQISFNVDARRRFFQGKVEKPPVQGHSLALSINRSIQYIAESTLAEGVGKNLAAAGVAIVMESDTGRILAFATYPDFNCNTYNEYSADRYRNRAVSDLFEPGSTFKAVVASAALEARVARPDELIDCQMGSITIGGQVFHDHKPYGVLTFSQVLEHSSNVGAAKLGLRLGEKRLYEALRTFGFGTKTDVDLPAEIFGLVRDWRHWSALSIGAISFGQEVGVTSLQMLVAINTIANGGYRVRPTLVDRIIDQDGNLVRSRVAERSRIISPETAASIREAFEGVVLRGTGRQAALEGYRTGGKTGTAQKIVDGRYSNTKYVASFIGFAPLPRPKITVLVQIDEPHGKIYGGDVSAPVFRKIAQEVLLLLRVPPERTLPLPKFNPKLAASSSEDYLPNATPVIPLVSVDENAPTTGQDEVIKVRVGTKSVVVPDFRGMAKRKVLDRCIELGIKLESVGSGVAVSQVPPPGTVIPVGDVCSVTFVNGNTGTSLKLSSLNTNPPAGNSLITSWRDGSR